MAEGFPPDIQTEPTPEYLRTDKIFEHLYPGNKWADLPVFNPMNAGLPFIKFLLETESDTALGIALEAKRGFADRIEIPFPDKVSFALRLNHSIPTSEKAMLGWVDDLVKEDEILGGMALRDTAFVKAEHRVGLGGLTQGVVNDTVYDHTLAYLIGVLKDSKPSGLILFRKGDRPKGRLVRASIQSILKPIAAPV